MSSWSRATAGAVVARPLLWRVFRRGSVLVPFAFALAHEIEAQGVPPTGTARMTVTQTRTLTASPLRLVRCYEDGDVGCFRVIGNVVDRSTSGNRMAATLDSASLLGPGLARGELDPDIALKLLIAFDVSGSMATNGGFEAARFAVGRFLRKLPRGVSVALVPFESRRVRQGFTAATFGPPLAAAARLKVLPRPDLGGNTALYEAVFDGLRTLDQHRSPEQSVLLVLTDGVNDVNHSGDDPGLLSGDAGRSQVRDAVRKSSHRIWLLGVGRGVDSAGLAQIAGSEGRSRVVEIEIDLLSLALDAIRDEMTPRRTLVYGVPISTFGELGRRARQFRLDALDDSPRRWRPPLVALPPFEGLADSTLVPRGMRVLSDELDSALRQRILIGGPLFVIVLLAYLAVPRILGAPAPSSATPVEDGNTPERAPSVAVGQLLPSVEAPPRRPSDITKDASR